MAKLFLTISRGGTARNLLRTDFFKILKESGHKIVIITPAYNDSDFLELASGQNTEFENLLIDVPWRIRDRILVGIHKALVYNKSTRFRDLYGIYDPNEGSYLKYLLKKIFILPLSKIQSLKRLARRIDYLIAGPRFYADLFIKHKPDLLFATSMTEDAEVEVMKQAERFGVPIVGMPKTWDNLSKINLRVLPNRIIVWGEYSKKEVERFSAIHEFMIDVCGIPQFDFYKNRELIESRDEFLRKYNLDASRPVIVYCSEGRIMSADKDISETIVMWIRDKVFDENPQMLIRPHFMYPDDEKKFLQIELGNGIALDAGWKVSKSFKDRWDYSTEQIKRFTNIMYHADIVITSVSTVSIDAVACGKPVINVYYDGNEKKNFNFSIKRWYTSEHYSSVIETQAISVARDNNELKKLIAMYLKNPMFRKKQREELVEYFGYKNDGKSGERLASIILKYLNMN